MVDYCCLLLSFRFVQMLIRTLNYAFMLFICGQRPKRAFVHFKLNFIHINRNIIKIHSMRLRCTTVYMCERDDFKSWNCILRVTMVQIVQMLKTKCEINKQLNEQIIEEVNHHCQNANFQNEKSKINCK